MQIEENIALAPFTTFKLGGAARFFVAAQTVDDIQNALKFAEEKDLHVFVLGGGSNLLVDDAGFDGLVLKVELKSRFKTLEQDNNLVEVTADAGEVWDALVQYTVEQNLWGIENLSGIPGTVGGACVQNIGAYGAALSEVLKSVDVFDTKEKKIKTLTRDECAFGYRGSIFKQEEGRYVVVHATLTLSREPAPNVSYKDLKARFADSSLDLLAIRAAVLEIRKAKFPDLSVEGTAGSFFKNPIMSKAEAEVLKQKYPEMPLFEMPETDGIKVPLGWLLDHALLLHGTHMGGARVFEKQILVIAASRNGSADDVQKLSSLITKKVFDELKIKIEPEVKII